MENKTIKLNSGSIIIIRKNLDRKINDYWRIIRSENVMSKKAKKAGLGSNYDLKALYNEITHMANKRIMIKGMLQYLNMGITMFDIEAFKKTNNYSIFAAGEAKEAIAQLKMIKTINPALKAEKGLDKLSKIETFTSAKIASLINKHQMEANKHDAALDKFNKNTMIDLANCSNNFIDDITV